MNEKLNPFIETPLTTDEARIARQMIIRNTAALPNWKARAESAEWRCKTLESTIRVAREALKSGDLHTAAFLLNGF